MGAFASELGEMDMVLAFVVKVYISHIICFLLQQRLIVLFIGQGLC